MSLRKRRLILFLLLFLLVGVVTIVSTYAMWMPQSLPRLMDHAQAHTGTTKQAAYMEWMTDQEVYIVYGTGQTKQEVLLNMETGQETNSDSWSANQISAVSAMIVRKLNASYQETRLPTQAQLETFSRSVQEDFHVEYFSAASTKDRLLWQLSTLMNATVQVKLHQILPGIPYAPHLKYAFYISKEDGSQPHLLGVMYETAGDANNMPVRDMLNTVKWSPNGKRLGLVYKGVFYTLPVE